MFVSTAGFLFVTGSRYSSMTNPPERRNSPLYYNSATARCKTDYPFQLPVLGLSVFKPKLKTIARIESLVVVGIRR